MLNEGDVVKLKGRRISSAPNGILRNLSHPSSDPAHRTVVLLYEKLETSVRNFVHGVMKL